MNKPTLRTPYMVVERPAFGDRRVAALLPLALNDMYNLHPGGCAFGAQAVMLTAQCMHLVVHGLPDDSVGIAFVVIGDQTADPDDLQAIYPSLEALVGAERAWGSLALRGDA